jgi:hypothetical protein
MFNYIHFYILVIILEATLREGQGSKWTVPPQEKKKNVEDSSGNRSDINKLT